MAASLWLLTVALLIPAPPPHSGADAYITWMAPGTLEQPVTGGSFGVRDQETQLGTGLSGLLSFFRGGSVSPFDFLLGLGTAIRWGSRRLLVEGRLYGGTAICLPITLGLTF